MTLSLLKIVLINSFYRKLKNKLIISENEYELLLNCSNCKKKLISFYKNQIIVLEDEMDKIEDLIDTIEENYMNIII